MPPAYVSKPETQGLVCAEVHKIDRRLPFMKKFLGIVVVLLLAIAGCGSINYLQLSPNANEFHPASIAILPATVGEFEVARDTIDTVMSRKMLETNLFENVVDNASIRVRMSSSSEFANDIGTYIQKMNTLGVSDIAMASKLRTEMGADALLLTYVTSWGYGRMEGNKVAKVGLGIKLVDASKGTVIVKANHELIEEYSIFKPDLTKLTEKLVAMLLKEIPITKATKSAAKAASTNTAAAKSDAPEGKPEVTAAEPSKTEGNGKNENASK